MKIQSLVLVVISLVLAAGPLAPAQEPPVEQQSSTTGPAVIPELNIHEVPLEEVIESLRKADPNFQVVVSYAPGAKRGDPIIQELRLKNVSAPAVLQVLSEAYPQITIGQSGAQSDTPESVIWTIRVQPDRRQEGGHGGLGGGGGEGLFGGSGGDVAPPETITTVQRLREIVDELAVPTAGEQDRAASRKKALDSVVSLVQAVVDSQGESATGATIKVHEATETLLFKGSPQLAALVANTLQTIAPTQDKQVSAANARIRGIEQEAQSLIDALRREIKAQQKRIAELEAKLAESAPKPQP